MEEENKDESLLTKKEKRELAKTHKQEETIKQTNSQKIQKLFFIAVGIVIVGFLGFKAYSYFSAPVETVSQSLYSISGTDWVRGNQDAQVTIIEYGDFECPACAIFSELVNDVYEKYKDKAKFTFRHFPLPQHTKAMIGSRAAEAAGRQGKFWDMHDFLFSHQEEWVKDSNSKDKVYEYARQMGLDMDKFDRDYNSDEVKNKIEADSNGGYQLRVNATPTFFVNGKKLDNIRGREDFYQVVEKELSTQ
ncbi:MAG TPA: thioredoxin domain-containing protein [Patescibacteria group bacterium]|nr:thioredoxin domain-containing protein [Patescibacteria group bacterium]